jgi:hypothetical protein
VLLDDEFMPLAARLAAARLRRHIEPPFLAIDLEGHGSTRLAALARAGAQN